MKGFQTLFIAGGFFLLAMSCKKESEIPSGVLSREQMVKVLTEVYTMEERINRMGVHSDSAASIFRLYRDSIQSNTGVPDSVYDASMQYYLDNPKELELIYTALVDSLQLMEQRTPQSPMK